MITIGSRLTIDQRYGFPASVATAVVLSFEPYRGQGGYYISWDYGRPKEMWETGGGWMPANLIIGFADEVSS